ncbi:N-acyl-D-amino-acid deacylase family protein [Kordiimonas pumila]|uniref:Amidohydrolase family protein n=1 Tax=Kordiimonas pumila TaxID=2161677 RepID=A0ABV7D1A9_9PROT|nr:D-aminoacylase [Kordiimonas pumila]
MYKKLSFRDLPIKTLFSRLGLGAFFLISACSASPENDTWLISNIVLVDGTGADAHKASVRISGAKIVSVGNLTAGTKEKVLNGNGLVLAPGFIDSHSHHDRGMFETPSMIAVTNQGVTTIIVGQDGFSQIPLSKFYNSLENNPVAVNVGSYTGHNSLRSAVMPATDIRRPATPDEVHDMVSMLETDIKNGSFGLSSGLGYETGVFSDRAELLSLAKANAAMGGRYISHIRNENTDMADAINEVIEIGRETHGPVQVSHIKVGTKKLWGTANDYIRLLDSARAEGIDITADIYPYTYWQTTMRILFPNKNYTDPEPISMHFKETLSPSGVIVQRFMPDPTLEGLTIADIAHTKGTDPVTTYMNLMGQVLAYEKSNPDAEHVESIIGTSMSEDDVESFLKWAHSNICSDGLDGGHPRGYGTFTRVLGHYVREKKSLSLESAIHKMSGMTAEHLGLEKRGLIKPGYAADLVLLNPTTVADMATVLEPKALSKGIENVWVNGTLVYKNGKSTGASPGQIIKPSPVSVP